MITKKKLLTICMIAYIVIFSFPAIDYYIDWYITVLPIIVIIFEGTNKKYLRRTLLLTVLFLLLTSLLYWLVYRGHAIVNFYLNNFISMCSSYISLRVLSQYEKKDKQKLLQVIAGALTITSITTYIGLLSYPSASRLLATGTVFYDTTIFSRMNIGGFGFIYSLVCFLPIQIWLIRHRQGIWKGLSVAELIAHFFVVIKSSYATALLLFLLMFGVCLFLKNKKTVAVVIIGLLVSAFGLKRLLIVIIEFLRETIASEYVADRLLQIIQFLNYESISTETTTRRMDLYRNAFHSFAGSPIWGNNIVSFDSSKIGGHSTVLDLLSGGGILGIFICFLIVYAMIHVCGIVDNTYSVTYIQLVLAFVIVSCTNPVNTSPLIFMVFFIAGGCINSLDDMAFHTEKTRFHIKKNG